jgi:hypothetical protein
LHSNAREGVFIISGLPYLAMASFKASTQKLASNVLDNLYDSTFHVAQSIIATRQRKPCRTGI